MMSYNQSIDAEDLVTESGLNGLKRRRNLEEVKVLNIPNSEYRKRFEDKLSSLPKDSPQRKWFDSLDDASRRSAMRVVIDIMDKIPNIVLSVAGLSVTEGKSITAKDILNGFEFDFGYLGKKNDPNSQPRFVFPLFNVQKFTKSYQETNSITTTHTDLSKIDPAT